MSYCREQSLSQYRVLGNIKGLISLFLIHTVCLFNRDEDRATTVEVVSFLVAKKKEGVIGKVTV